MKYLEKNSQAFLFFVILISGAFFRFYNLNWDGGFFFNPDEGNNIAHPAANLKFPFKPAEFTYGTLTIYLYRLVSFFLSILTRDPNWQGAANINLIGRFISGLIGLLIIYLIFVLGKGFFSQKTGLLAAFFTSLSVGLIQAAHFGSTESIITLSMLLMVSFSIKINFGKNLLKNYLLAGLTLGTAASAKVSSLLILPPFLLINLILITKRNILKTILFFSSFLGISLFIFLIIFPYSLLDFSSFWDSFLFEQKVAKGDLSVFYTIQFKKTAPYLFQATRIFPWILSWPLTIASFLGFLLVIWQTLKTRNKEFLILLVFPLFYFLATGQLFVKWTRYMVPLIPFFCLFAAYFFIFFSELKNVFVKRLIFITLILISLYQLFYALSFWQTYRREDSRNQASLWIYQNLPKGSVLLLEPLDVVSLPLPLAGFNPDQYQQVWFDFYTLDPKTPGKIKALAQELERTDYFIIGSRRIYANLTQDQYPQTARFYQFLFDGLIGFDKIKTISSYPNFAGFEINDDTAEETFQVFDHPKIMIFKNQAKLSADDLVKILSLK